MNFGFGFDIWEGEMGDLGMIPEEPAIPEAEEGQDSGEEDLTRGIADDLADAIVSAMSSLKDDGNGGDDDLEGLDDPQDAPDDLQDEEPQEDDEDYSVPEFGSALGSDADNEQRGYEENVLPSDFDMNGVKEDGGATPINTDDDNIGNSADDMEFEDDPEDMDLGNAQGDDLDPGDLPPPEQAGEPISTDQKGLKHLLDDLKMMIHGVGDELPAEPDLDDGMEVSDADFDDASEDLGDDLDDSAQEGAELRAQQDLDGDGDIGDLEDEEASESPEEEASESPEEEDSEDLEEGSPHDDDDFGGMMANSFTEESIDDNAVDGSAENPGPDMSGLDDEFGTQELDSGEYLDMTEESILNKKMLCSEESVDDKSVEGNSENPPLEDLDDLGDEFGTDEVDADDFMGEESIDTSTQEEQMMKEGMYCEDDIETDVQDPLTEDVDSPPDDDLETKDKASENPEMHESSPDDWSPKFDSSILNKKL